ncbi:asparagine synthase (glutamine-hydrolyzing) [Deinococcus sp. SDU3-2]|uniref:asparagine synthase (glutamine-hydrolyzing) n=1 Tax=Deinococcus terrestris TaxID=2651870 RepID=A0A7X1TSP8_9DEIO|nr:asparagine synthase (glutamine-hydrolyzing) [Deinococcus terrestris]MPY67617.1 asparagine synthase (glutamine-hydrolyzing) [Deinococcus terrestris]
MCGIAGIWHAQEQGPVGEGTLRRGLEALRHRGPDGEGLYHTPDVHLGMRRLAIIDLAGGDQPLYNEDGSVAVVFNGEIYNYKELRAGLRARGHTLATSSDTEVLVHLYEERGPELVQELRGMFAFALHDRRRRRVVLARDRFGKKPLYYLQTSAGAWLFASELKALRAMAAECGEPLSLNPQALYDFLSLGSVPQPSTIFRGVYALPPGSWATLDESGLKIQRYWAPEFLPKHPLGYGEAQERVRDLVAEAVRLRLRSDVPLGVFLSGGVDSTVVAYEAAQVVGDTLQTFTVAVEDRAFDESAIAAQTARRLGVQHTVLPLKVEALGSLQALVRQYDQPFADPSAIPSLGIAQLAREHVKVVLNGDGGDEVFGGYRRYVAAQWASPFSHLPRPVLRGVSQALGQPAARRSALGFGARFVRGLTQPAGERYLTWTTDILREQDKRDIWRGAPQLPTEDRVAARLDPRLDLLDSQVALDLQFNLLSGLLVKMDIATMAHSLEARSPLLDHRLAEFALRLPGTYRVRGSRAKAVLRDAYREPLAAAVVQGPKRGFEIPLERWLREDFREVLHDTLGAPDAQVRDWVDPTFVDGLLARRLLPDRNWATLVYMLLTLELWLREQRESGVLEGTR